MKFLISILAAVSLLVAGVPAQRVSAQDISNSPNNYAFGVLQESISYPTGLDYFTITNNSTYAIVVTIRGSDMTGGNTWTLSDAPGPDTYGLRAGLSGESYNITVTKTDNVLIGNLTESSSQQWGLQFLAPTEFSDGAEKSGTVTLTATQA